MSGGFDPPTPHDPPCPFCGCGFHHWLDCPDCGCSRHDRPGDA